MAHAIEDPWSFGCDQTLSLDLDHSCSNDKWLEQMQASPSEDFAALLECWNDINCSGEPLEGADSLTNQNDLTGESRDNIPTDVSNLFYNEDCVSYNSHGSNRPIAVSDQPAHPSSRKRQSPSLESLNVLRVHSKRMRRRRAFSKERRQQVAETRRKGACLLCRVRRVTVLAGDRTSAILYTNC